MRSEATQRRLLSEDKLDLKKAYEIALSMEAANKQASELHASISRPKDIHQLATRKPQKSCHRCGCAGHSPDACYFREQKYRACGKKGHIAKVCHSTENSASRDKGKPPGKFWRKRPPQGTGDKHKADYVAQQQSDRGSSPEGQEDMPVFMIQTVKGKPETGITVEPEVNGVPLEMELDTGASVSIVPEKTWKDRFPGVQLENTGIQLKTCTGEELRVLGQIQVRVKYENQEHQLPLLVVEGEGPPLFERNWRRKIQLKKHLSFFSLNP